jgi:hypothetical protein
MENQDVNPIPTTPVTPQSPTGGQEMMPGAVMWMVFGIISVCLLWFGIIPFAGIFLAIVALVFGILAFIKGKKLGKEFEANPGKYKPASKVFIKVASITGLVGLILSCIFLVLGIIMTILALTETAYHSTYYY